jgi:hypothetical protein
MSWYLHQPTRYRASSQKTRNIENGGGNHINEAINHVYASVLSIAIDDAQASPRIEQHTTRAPETGFLAIE